MPTLTAQEVAADLQLSVYTALQHMRSGAIAGAFQVVPGGPWRVDVDTYTAWRATKGTTQKRTTAQNDPERIEPRSARSRAAQSRTTRHR